MLYKLQFSYSTFRILNQCIVAKKYFLFRLVTYYKLHSIPSKSVLGTTVNELVLPMTNYETNQASIENGYSEMNIYDLYHRMARKRIVAFNDNMWTSAAAHIPCPIQDILDMANNQKPTFTLDW